MGLKKIIPEAPKVKEPEKKEVKPKKEFIIKTVPKKVVTEKKESVIIPQEKQEKIIIPEATETKNKKDWDGLGLIGDNEVLRVFKGKHKAKGLKIGQTIYNLLNDWNGKN